jgi:hypothetical protein
MELFNWQIKEEDIHGWLIESYENLDYDCVSFHESGPSLEEGVDVLAQKGKEKVAIAVKIKPSSKDLKQLDRLIKNKYKRKIYVYIKNPSKPFFEKLEGLRKKNRVEVLNAQKLHDFLIQTKCTQYVKEYLFSQELFSNIESILRILYDAKETRITKVTKSEIPIMWEWKDRAISFHKTAKTIHDYVEPKIRGIVSEDEKGYGSIINEVLDILSYMNREAEQLKSVFEKITKTNPELLSSMWRKCRHRSNWCCLLGYLENHNPHETVFKFFIGKINAGPYTLLARILENIYEFGYDLEEAVNWVFEGRDF